MSLGIIYNMNELKSFTVVLMAVVEKADSVLPTGKELLLYVLILSLILL